MVVIPGLTDSLGAVGKQITHFILMSFQDETNYGML